jgi:hypothetical protein
VDESEVCRGVNDDCSALLMQRCDKITEGLTPADGPMNFPSRPSAESRVTHVKPLFQSYMYTSIPHNIEAHKTTSPPLNSGYQPTACCAPNVSANEDPSRSTVVLGFFQCKHTHVTGAQCNTESNRRLPPHLTRPK